MQIIRIERDTIQDSIIYVPSEHADTCCKQRLLRTLCFTLHTMPSGNSASTRKINLVRIAQVFYTHKAIDNARQFLDDFGFQELSRVGKNTYYRGYGTEPFVHCATEGSEDKFGGAAFVVESKEDLELASRTIPGATEVHEMREEPGGGLRVTFTDPVDEFPFHLVWGQTPANSSPEETESSQQDFNYVRLQTSVHPGILS